jgi:hypothetical protein
VSGRVRASTRARARGARASPTWWIRRATSPPRRRYPPVAKRLRPPCHFICAIPAKSPAPDTRFAAKAAALPAPSSSLRCGSGSPVAGATTFGRLAPTPPESPAPDPPRRAPVERSRHRRRGAGTAPAHLARPKRGAPSHEAVRQHGAGYVVAPLAAGGEDPRRPVTAPCRPREQRAARRRACRRPPVSSRSSSLDRRSCWSSNSIASGASIEPRQTAGFVTELAPMSRVLRS